MHEYRTLTTAAQNEVNDAARDKTPAYQRISESNYSSMLKHWHVISLIALPLLITLINPNWIYNPDVLNDVDTWVYHGLFRYFFDFATTSPSNLHYFIERLSWILPGYVLYKIFTPVLANAILHLSVYYIGLFAIYGTARQLFGKTPALVAVICLGSYTWFLRAAGHDYLDGAGIAYFSAAIWFATTAAYRTHARWYLFGAGACLALTLVTQLTWAAFVPVVAVYYLLLTGYRSGRIVLEGFWVAFGGLVILSGFVIFNVAALGEWNIFGNSIWFMRTSSGISEALRKDISLFYAPTPSTWIVFSCLMAICAACFLARWNQVDSKFRSPLRAVIIAFALMVGVFCFLHFSSPFQYFYVYLYASFLIPVTFLLFAGVLAASNLPALSPRQVLISLLLVLAPFALIVLFRFLEPLRLNAVVVWLVTGVSMTLITFGVLKGRKPFVVIGAFSVMSFIISGYNGVAFHDRLHTYKRFIGVDAILETIEAQYPQMSRFSNYVVWNETRSFGAFAHAVRGVSQPIGTHGATLYTFKDSRDGNELETEVILLSDIGDILDKVSETLGDGYRITINGSFDLPSIDNTGSFRGYVLSIEREHSDTAAVPREVNIHLNPKRYDTMRQPDMARVSSSFAARNMP